MKQQQHNFITIKQLNLNYAIPDQLSFIEGSHEKANFSFIHISNKYADAVVSVYGGQVLSFHPRQHQQDALFLSDHAFYQRGKAIKGGIPICWPWFGDDPEGLGRDAHGFVRNRLWSVQKTAVMANGETQLILGLVDTAETQTIWPYAFNLSLTITVGKTLRLELVTHNTGDIAFSITQALHSYFAVGDIGQCHIVGLTGKEYVDKTTHSLQRVKQQDDVIINKEVDRIYIHTTSSNAPSEIKLVDEALKRKLVISSQGSNSTVVWNPWIKKTAQMVDLQNDDYLHFLCIETANAASDVVEVQSNDCFYLEVEITVDTHLSVT